MPKYCKLRKILLGVSTFFLFFGKGSVAYTASFSCEKVTAHVEHLICNDETLSDLDELMAITYSEAKENESMWQTEPLLQTQLAWIKERDSCKNEDCVSDKYISRLVELSAESTRLQSRSAAISYIYVGEPDLSQCPESSELSSWGQCVEWIQGGANLDAVILAHGLIFNIAYVGANAHTCSLSGIAKRETDKAWRFRDDSFQCELKIKINPSSISTEANQGCNAFCGVRAAGGLTQHFAFEH